MITAGAIIKPIVFALLFSVTLLPVQRLFERKLNPGLSSVCTVIVALFPLFLIGAFIYAQLGRVIGDLPNIGTQLQIGLNKASDYITQVLPDVAVPYVQQIKESAGDVGPAIASIIGNSLTGSIELLGSTGLMLLLIFFFLWYRNPLKQVVFIQFTGEAREDLRRVTKGSKAMLSSYLSGLLMVILLMGIVNSIGLTIIGVGYAVFWGFLAAFLTIIPYVGTTIGGTLPFLYALATAGTIWQPVAVVIFYGVVQQIEGNVITPKIVGDKVKINPLVAIIGLLFGGLIWGIAGIVLSIPVLAIIRIIFNEIDALRPIAILMSSEITSKGQLIRSTYDAPAFRIKNLFGG